MIHIAQDILASPGRSVGSCRWRVMLMALAVLLAACSGSGISQASQTDHYTVQLSLDGTGFGEHTATIEVNDKGGQPVVANQVVLSPVMAQMGMAAPEATAQMVAPGRYQAKGEFFSMVGEWRVDVRIDANGMEEVARFNVQATQE